MKKEKIKLKSYQSLKKELLKNPEVKKSYKESSMELKLVRQIINSRIKKDISQKELAKRLGTGQSAVSRLESGLYNPSYKFLQKLAKALDSELIIEFK